MEGPLKIDPCTDVTSACLHMDKVEDAGVWLPVSISFL